MRRVLILTCGREFKKKKKNPEDQNSLKIRCGDGERMHDDIWVSSLPEHGGCDSIYGEQKRKY